MDRRFGLTSVIIRSIRVNGDHLWFSSRRGWDVVLVVSGDIGVRLLRNRLMCGGRGGCCLPTMNACRSGEQLVRGGRLGVERGGGDLARDGRAFVGHLGWALSGWSVCRTTRDGLDGWGRAARWEGNNPCWQTKCRFLKPCWMTKQEVITRDTISAVVSD